MPLPDTMGGQASRLLEQMGARTVPRTPKPPLKTMYQRVERMPSRAPSTYNPMQGFGGSKVNPMMARRAPAQAFDPTDILAWLAKVGDTVRRTIATVSQGFGSVTPSNTPGDQAARDAFTRAGVIPQAPAKPWWQP